MDWMEFLFSFYFVERYIRVSHDMKVNSKLATEHDATINYGKNYMATHGKLNIKQSRGKFSAIKYSTKTKNRKQKTRKIIKKNKKQTNERTQVNQKEINFT